MKTAARPCRLCPHRLRARGRAAGARAGRTGRHGTLLVGNKGENTLSLHRSRHGARARPGGDRADAARDRGLARRPAGGGGRLWRTHDRHFRRGAAARSCAPSTSAPNEGPHGIAWLSRRPDPRHHRAQPVARHRRHRPRRRGERDRAPASRARHMVAVTPDGGRAYTANIAAGDGQRDRSRGGRASCATSRSAGGPRGSR